MCVHVFYLALVSEWKLPRSAETLMRSACLFQDHPAGGALVAQLHVHTDTQTKHTFIIDIKLAGVKTWWSHFSWTIDSLVEIKLWFRRWIRHTIIYWCLKHSGNTSTHYLLYRLVTCRKAVGQCGLINKIVKHFPTDGSQQIRFPSNCVSTALLAFHNEQCGLKSAPVQYKPKGWLWCFLNEG